MTLVFCDANVLFAAAISPDGRAAALFDLQADLVASPYVLEESRRNVALRYPDSLARFDELVRRLVVVGEADPDLVAWAAEQGLPAGDAPVLAAAVGAGTDLLVTGDRRHFGHLFGRKLRGTRVVSLRQALASLLR